MRMFRMFSTRCRTNSRAKDLPSSTSQITRIIACICAAGLVIASMGFGAVFAWQIGISHGLTLACLTVLFAVALELAKPLAIHSALQSLGSWRTWPRAVALGLLGTVAVAYSLTSELALTAQSRGDLTASREQNQDASQKAGERHQRAKAELATLKPSRPIEEAKAEIASLLARNAKAPDCTAMDTGLARSVCPKVEALKGEIARTKRRAELEAILSTAETTIAKTPTAKAADPGSAAVATYLSAMGWSVPLDALAQWLALVPVLALELGSALAGVLVASVSGPRREPETVAHVVPEVVQPLDQQETRPQLLLPDRSQRQRDAVARMILAHLKDHGGSVPGSERGIARVTSTSKATARRTIQALASAGMITVAADKSGTVLSLVQ